ncbi:MAG: hypothetical protein CL771_02950 [Chloroflexi bacterium]|nr:hypothetical protein [Chloroflexota bacterium]|tara:strand:+ start:900 stop:1256 length:357 start_codon:yes stop_codon:yes gene_type:complete
MGILDFLFGDSDPDPVSAAFKQYEKDELRYWRDYRDIQIYYRSLVQSGGLGNSKNLKRLNRRTERNRGVLLDKSVDSKQKYIKACEDAGIDRKTDQEEREKANPEISRIIKGIQLQYP